MIFQCNLAAFSTRAAILLAALSFTFPALAQQPQPPSPDSSKTNDQPKNQSGHDGTSNDRLFFALPNFLTLETTDKIPPLTTRQKFAVVSRSSFDYIQIPWFAILAGISQAQNGDPGYGQGATGYGKRYGAAWADGTIETYWSSAILASLLHQDPRFYEMGKGGFWHRVGYSSTRIVVTRSDSGHNQFNASEVFGAAIAAGISTYTYHPPADRTVRNAGIVCGTQLGIDSMATVLKEFWPDIRRKLRKK